jgi:hypothetical protein
VRGLYLEQLKFDVAHTAKLLLLAGATMTLLPARLEHAEVLHVVTALGTLLAVF